MAEKLVERLRGTWSVEASVGDNPQLTELNLSDSADPLCLEAADTIERLEAERDTAQERWQILVNTIADAFNDRIVDGNNAEAVANACTMIAEARAREEQRDDYFTRIIQVRGGAGMLQGRDALDEMARLAGEALAVPAPEPYEEYIPAGHHIVEDADGARYVKNPEPAPEREAERRVVEALELFKAWVGDGERRYEPNDEEAKLRWVDVCSALAAQQQAPESE